MAASVRIPLNSPSPFEPRHRESPGRNSRPPTSPPEIARQVAALGVMPGDLLLAHVSFRSARPIEGGPAGLLAGLQKALGPRGTFVMPSYSGDDDRPFEPASSPADPDLGVVADTFWRSPGVLRSAHPFAFAARGPLAQEITSDPIALPPHNLASPVGQVFRRNGRILLIGVGHQANTTIHLAELLAGVRYRRRKHCTVLSRGRPVRLDYEENDHCCERFSLVDGWLRTRRLQAEGPVGHAHARLAKARDVVAVVSGRLRQDTTLFLHARGSGCEECDDAWRSVADGPS